MAAASHGIELSEGDEFAGYRIERCLGRGGMGVLYLALEPGLERRVALKLIAPEAPADGVFARRFAEESKVAASIEHPNVVPIYAAGEEAGVPFIAMRYVAGADLAKRLSREGRLEPAVAVELIAQVGDGLDAIHTAGLIHRDVKPANVLLSGGEGAEHAYITDFGVARNVSTQAGLTQTGRFVGTLDYVAPEQASGKAVDARADVYALGCLLFKLLTGEVPFPRDDDAARLFAHLRDLPPAPSLWVPEVSPALDDVVIRAMSKSAEDRFPSAGDLGRAARAALRGEQARGRERTVATGGAATRTAETIAVDSTEAGARAPETSATRRLSPQSATDLKRPSRGLILAGGLVVVATLAVTVALVGGGGGGGSSPPAAPRASKPATREQQAKAKSPLTLSKSELIAKADAICEESQNAYKSVRSKVDEESPDVAYSVTLAGISTHGVERFKRLAPPAGVKTSFERYVRAQERVRRYDREALKAAETDDTSAYLAARASRDNEEAERYDLARAVGFEQCSTKR
jgi:hypothetical protein